MTAALQHGIMQAAREQYTLQFSRTTSAHTRFETALSDITFL